MRFFTIFIGVTLMFFLSLFMTRQWGLRQSIPEFKHPFLEQSPPWSVLVVTDIRTANAALKIKPDLIFELPLRVTEDGQFYLQDSRSFENSLLQKKWDPSEYRGPKPYFYNFAQLQKKFPEIIKVEEFLKAFPKNRIIFNIQDSAQNVHAWFIDMMKKSAPQNLFVVQSSTDVILKSIKELEPMWIYGTSYPEINRLLSLDSIGLGSAVQLRSDVYISPLNIQNRPVFSDPIYEELRRRKKKVLLGPIESEKDWEMAKKFHVDGVIFSRLEDLEKSSKESPSF